MDLETRKKEIIEAMSDTCSKDSYTRDELLPEMKALEKRMVELVFNKSHLELAELNMNDAIAHLEQLNQERGANAKKNIKSLRNCVDTLHTQLEILSSGEQGEQATFACINNLSIPFRMLTNVEFCDDYYKTEIDAIVFTPQGVTIVEVKNVKHQATIFSNGNFYRNGKYDCDLSGKIRTRQEIVRDKLSEIGFKNVYIQSIVVFSNPQVQYENKCNDFIVCRIDKLNEYINSIRSSKNYSDTELDTMQSYVLASTNKIDYSLDFDENKLKQSFATVMAKIEMACRCEEQETISTKPLDEVVKVEEKETMLARVTRIAHSKVAKRVGYSIIPIGVGVASYLLGAYFGRQKRK